MQITGRDLHASSGSPLQKPPTGTESVDYYNPDASVTIAPERFIVGDVSITATQETAAQGH